MTERMKYVLALVVGLLAIPGFALAANQMLAEPSPPEDTVEVQAVAIQRTSATSLANEAFTADDLVRACGVEGRYLVELELGGLATDLQVAALGALRPICEDAGLPLPPAPIPDELSPIIETVTVVRRVTVPAAQALPPPVVPAEPLDEDGDEEETDETPATTTTSSPTSSTTTTAQAQPEPDTVPGSVLAARDLALTAINAAINGGGKAEKINEAIIKASIGDENLAQGAYEAAETNYHEAIKKAEEALREIEDD